MYFKTCFSNQEIVYTERNCSSLRFSMDYELILLSSNTLMLNELLECTCIETF